MKNIIKVVQVKIEKSAFENLSLEMFLRSFNMNMAPGLLKE